MMASGIKVKQEDQETPENPLAIICISSGNSSSNFDPNTDDVSDGVVNSKPTSKRSNGLSSTDASTTLKKPKLESSNNNNNNHQFTNDDSNKSTPPDVTWPVGFLDPLSSDDESEYPSALPLRSFPPVNGDHGIGLPSCSGSREIVAGNCAGSLVVKSNKQFWKAGDYEGEGNAGGCSEPQSDSMDHLRVHPKFLHSNATSHKWALGAVAELLDNALDEVSNGASYVKVDMLVNPKDHGKMLLVQDNGGGMSPEKMRACVSLGYSAKRKLSNTIGQYGNGFKTSTMRLGADVIVFSCCKSKEGSSRPTRSIGMLSYTFLRGTHKQDIVVPMIDFELREHRWTCLMRKSSGDWLRNLDTITQWSPYATEQDLLQQFDFLEEQGTRIVIYNLWEDDTGRPELDFDTDKHDIQIQGVRDEKKAQMAARYPNSKHYLTYNHSLRSYAAILYLRLPDGFRIILRGKDVEHHDLVNDMMFTRRNQYRPKPIPGVPLTTDSEMVADFTIGFAKGAEDHIDIQGFNVYHKNRLIKPFWRVWNAAGSDGRGVIGVLEANFVEPAHDKQGFERTIALQRLESQLLKLQKSYWRDNCDKIGYAPRRNVKNKVSPMRELPQPPSAYKGKSPPCSNGYGGSSCKEEVLEASLNNKTTIDIGSPSTVASGDNGASTSEPHAPITWGTHAKRASTTGRCGCSCEESLIGLRRENADLNQRLEKMAGSRAYELVQELRELQARNEALQQLLAERQRMGELLVESSRHRSLELRVAELQKENDILVEIISKEKETRAEEKEQMTTQLELSENEIEKLRKESQEKDAEVENLREKIREASETIDNLLAKIKKLERD